MLSNLQQQLAAIFSSLDVTTSFAMAGGGALIVHGAIQRPTHDLDYFTTDPSEVDLVLPAFDDACQATGLRVIREQSSPGFARLLISDGAEETRVDLAADARLLPVVSSPYGLLLAAEELAVDKVLAVFGRAEARDFADLAALEAMTGGLCHLFELARQKDLGFQAAVFRHMLNRFDRLPRDEFHLTMDEFGQLRSTVARWGHEIDAVLDDEQ